MTPAARVAAAIGILDQMSEGMAAEKTLTRWGRQNRYAGSKDRAAVRDHVFHALRVKHSAQYLGGGDTGRAAMIGLLRHQGVDPKEYFTAIGHAPPELSKEEQEFSPEPVPDPLDWNLPDWLIAEFQNSLGEKAKATALALQARAPISLRVNQQKSTRQSVQTELAEAGITTQINNMTDMGLTVIDGARRLRQSEAYQQGRVELQDAASQAVVAMVPQGKRCLDFCAGGGGKALALAAEGTRDVFAHDIDPVRMSDLPQRAARAGVDIPQLKTAELGGKAPYDVVLCDAPCSGSGAWRRAPEGKWTLTPEALATLNNSQDAILRQAAELLAPGGTLIYATCSVLTCENEDRIQAFLQSHPTWKCSIEKRFDVCAQGDGFYAAHLTLV